MGIGRNKFKCNVCNNEIEGFKYVSMPEWNIPGYLCSQCYSKKLSQYYRPPKEDKEKK